MFDNLLEEIIDEKGNIYDFLLTNFYAKVTFLFKVLAHKKSPFS